MKKLPLVEHVKSLCSTISLENTLLIGSQHILETTHTMLQSLYEQGLNPNNIYLIGKCYSTNLAVWQEMVEDGIHVSPFSSSFDSHILG